MIEKIEDCPTEAASVDGQDYKNKIHPGNATMFYYVYLIRSIKYPQTIYVGYTTDIKKRLQTHNDGGSIHTKNDKPWEIVISISFRDMDCAKQFEKYLKTQSGRAFIKKRFL